MNIIHRRGWEIPDRSLRRSILAFSRREFARRWLPARSRWRRVPRVPQRVTDVAKLPDPSADLYPAKRNEKYTLDRPITDERSTATTKFLRVRHRENDRRGRRRR